MKVSVITVCLNNEKTIENTILSVLNQNYENLEYIIIDGGSTDNTKNIINKYKEKISIFVSQVDSGIYEAINKGLSISTGNIISLLHANEFLYDSKDIDNLFKKSNLYGYSIFGITAGTEGFLFD